MRGAVEGGGTKFLCGVFDDEASAGSDPPAPLHTVRIDTTSPDATLDAVAAFFEAHPVDRIGVATFGPLDLDPASSTYGETLETPKQGWDAVPVRARLAGALGCDVTIDTDVSAAALAEQRWGAGKDADPVVYITVGTGVGGGLVVHGAPVRGLMHPEMGHLAVPALRDAAGALDAFEGACRFHGRCLEGVASGTAIEARLGVPASEVPSDHPVWDLTARTLGHALAQITLITSPERIVIGGGVGGALPLPTVRRGLVDALGGYLPTAKLDPERLIVPAALDHAGLLGALLLPKPGHNGDTFPIDKLW